MHRKYCGKEKKLDCLSKFSFCHEVFKGNTVYYRFFERKSMRVITKPRRQDVLAGCKSKKVNALALPSLSPWLLVPWAL